MAINAIRITRSLKLLKTVPFFNYPALFATQESEITALLLDVLKRGAYIMQKELSQFEEHLADFLGVKYAIGVADGTIALVMALRGAGIQHGDEVIVPSHTFIASAASIHHAGATPVLVECASDHLIDPDSVKQAITNKTKAIMPVQLNGRTANMDALQAIADEYNLLIIEDSAQALGSKYKGKYASTFGIAGTFSFYPAKLLGCYGDGGAVITNDDQLAAKVYSMRDHGRGESGDVVLWGYNARLDNIQAAVLDFKLKTFPETVERRRSIAARYDHALSSISDLTLPPAPDASPDHFDVYQNYEIESGHRDQLREYLKDHGVGTIVQWGGKAIHQFEDLKFNVDLPYTTHFFTRCMMLPMHHLLSDEDVDYVCEQIHQFYSTLK
jgi:dTDP-4-amino-4,6-dideoxygalactose transaminase